MTQADAVSTTNLAITVSDLEVRGGVPQIMDLRLAAALGFANPHQIRPLIKRHLSALNEFGAVSPVWEKPSAKGGRPSTVYYLNEEQAIYITAKSDTPRAAEITVEMVRVFRAYRHGELKPVAVRQHRRALPAEPPPLPFGPDLARDFYEAIMSANVRVERGEDTNFGKALEGVLCDLVTAHVGGIPLSGKALFGAKVQRARVRASH